jgi:hypothetical protein
MYLSAGIGTPYSAPPPPPPNWIQSPKVEQVHVQGGPNQAGDSLAKVENKNNNI